MWMAQPNPAAGTSQQFPKTLRWLRSLSGQGPVPADAQTLRQMVRDKKQLFMSHTVLKHNPPRGATRQRMQPTRRTGTHTASNFVTYRKSLNQSHILLKKHVQSSQAMFNSKQPGVEWISGLRKAAEHLKSQGPVPQGGRQPTFPSCQLQPNHHQPAQSTHRAR